MNENLLHFKYFSDDPRIIKGVFRDNKIRFTQPWGMNDPLEFNPTLQFFNNEIAQQGYDLNGTFLPSIELFYRIQVIESQINAYGILSLTTQHRSFDMWSRYANGHKGFVLGFKQGFDLHQCMKSKDGEQNIFRGVNYVDQYILNIEELANEFDSIPWAVLQNELFFKKTSRWKDEQEYRLIRSLTDCPEYKSKADHSHRDNSIYLFDFSLECINDVIFGASMSIQNKKDIVDYCRLRKQNVNFWQAVIIKDEVDIIGKPSKIKVFPIVDYLGSLEEIYTIQPQQFCIDSMQELNNLKTVKIKRLSDLPYYEDYKELVDRLFEETNKRGINSQKQR